MPTNDQSELLMVADELRVGMSVRIPSRRVTGAVVSIDVVESVDFDMWVGIVSSDDARHMLRMRGTDHVVWMRGA